MPSAKQRSRSQQPPSTQPHSTSHRVYRVRCSRDQSTTTAKLPRKESASYGRHKKIELLGPVRPTSNWQAKTPGAYDESRFTIDWDAKRVTCPEGNTSVMWSERSEATGRPIIQARFKKSVCLACELRALCTRSEGGPRNLMFQPQAQYDILKEVCARQHTPEWLDRYHLRAGVEGLMSQGVQAHKMRQCRYRGLAKTALQHTATAAGINVIRVTDWLAGRRPEKTRTTHFQRLRVAA